MRTRATHAAAALLLLGLAACTDNDAIGNDRRAELDPPEAAAERAPAESLAQLAPGLLKPSPFTPADLASLPGSAAMCRFRYTDAGFPVVLYSAAGDVPAVLKLNGRLIALPPAGGAHIYAGGPVRVEVRHADGPPSAGDADATLVLRVDGAPDELGFAGEARCG